MSQLRFVQSMSLCELAIHQAVETEMGLTSSIYHFGVRQLKQMWKRLCSMRSFKTHLDHLDQSCIAGVVELHYIPARPFLPANTVTR